MSEPSQEVRKPNIVVVANSSGREGGGVPVFNMQLTSALTLNNNVYLVTALPIKDMRAHGNLSKHILVGRAKNETSETPESEKLSLKNSVYELTDSVGDARALLPEKVDVIIGHSRFSGRAASVLKDYYPNARLVHLLHTSPVILDLIKGLHAKSAPPNETASKRGREPDILQSPFFDGQWNAEIERDLMRNADLVVGVGATLADEAARLTGTSGKARKHPVHELIPGTEIDRSPAPRQAKAEPTLNLLLVGRADDPIKGVDRAIEAVRLARGFNFQISLTIRGIPAAHLDNFKRSLVDRNVDTFTTAKGYTLTPQDLLNDYRAADAVVMPSLHEGFGMIAFEALSVGTPVLVNEDSGAARFLSDPGRVEMELRGKSSVVQDPLNRERGDQSSLAAQIMRMCIDLEDRRKIAEGLRRLLEKYTWEHAAAALVEVAMGQLEESRTRQGPDGALEASESPGSIAPSRAQSSLSDRSRQPGFGNLSDEQIAASIARQYGVPVPVTMFPSANKPGAPHLAKKDQSVPI